MKNEESICMRICNSFKVSTSNLEHRTLVMSLLLTYLELNTACNAVTEIVLLLHYVYEISFFETYFEKL
jgi:hypothetical protein